MTIVVEDPSIIVNGNGTKTGYSYPFSLTDTPDLKIFYTPEGHVRRMLGTTDYIQTPNVGSVGGVVEFVTITPGLKDILEFSRHSIIANQVDFNEEQQVAYSNVDLEYSNVYRLLQEIKQILNGISDSKLPDPSLHTFGHIVVTDGANSYTFFPLRLTSPSQADDNKVLAVDWTSHTIKYISSTGSTNPPIPQPDASTEFKILGSKSGAYILGDSLPTLVSGDSGKFLQWDGTKYIALLAPGAQNPAIALPTGDKLTLTSKPGVSGGWTTEWVDDRYKTIETSSGVVDGLAITQTSGTTINIAGGIVQVVESTTGVPNVELITYAGATGLAVPTTVGTEHYVFLDLTAAPTIVFSSTRNIAPRGRVIYLGEITHSHNNEITGIHEDYTVVTSIASQLRDLITSLFGNVIKGTHPEPRSVLPAVTPNNLQIKFASGGAFIGYAANAATDILNPHIVGGVPAGDPATFRWRDALDRDSGLMTTIDSSNLMIDDGAGALTPVTNNYHIQSLVWIAPTGELIIQYPTVEWHLHANIPTIADFINQTPKSFSGIRNLAPFGVLQMKAGTDFSDLVDTFITPIAGLTITSSGSGTGDRLPFPVPGDVGKLLQVNALNAWVPSTFTIPTPAIADAHKTITVDALGKYALEDPADILARSWLTNGVLSGMKVTENVSHTGIDISAGKLVFCINNTVDEVEVIDFAGTVNWQLPGIGANDLSYVYINKNLVLSTRTSEDTAFRGDDILLYRIEHYANSVIEDIQAIYYGLQGLPEHIREIFERIGNGLKNFTLEASGTNVLKHGGGIYYGFDSGINTDLAIPHKTTLPAADPVSFKFLQINGTESALLTAFPAVPKVEAPAGTLTDLANGHVAYYPVWIYPDGYTLIQYATMSWTAGTEPDSGSIWLEFKRDATLEKAAVLAGFVKWEAGKDFTSGNVTVNIGSPAAGGGSGGFPLPATAADVHRVYTIDPVGKAVLGVRIVQPNLSSDLGDPLLVNKYLKYDSLGKDIVAGDILPPAVSSKGDHFVVSNNGNLEILDSKSDYVDPTIWSVSDIALYGVEPYFKKITRKGITISRFTLNQQGGDTIATPLRLADFIDHKTPSPPNISVSGATNWFLDAGNEPGDYYYNLNPRTNQSWIDPPAKTMIYHPSVRVTISRNTPHLHYNYCYCFEGNDPKPEDINLHQSSPISLKAKYFSPSESTSGVQPGGLHYFSGHRYALYLNIDSLTTGFSGKIKFGNVKIKPRISAVITSGTNWQGTYKSEMDLALLYTGDTGLGASAIKTIDAGPLGGPEKTINLNVETTFSSSAPGTTFFHDSKNTKSKYIVIGIAEKYDAPNTSTFQGLDTLEVEMELELNYPGAIPGIKRYETTSLSQIEALPDNAGTAFKDYVATGPKAALKPGKITLLYHLLFPKVATSLASFDPNLDGISLHPHDLKDIPSIFLEEQTGSTKYTNRIEATRRKGRATIFEVYELDCTAEQFNNWKLVIYFRSILSDAAFKSTIDNIGASLWIVNEEEFA